MLQQTCALHTQTEPLSVMSNGSTNAQIEPGYQHTTFPSSCLSAVHDRQERQGVLLIYHNGLRPGVHCYQLPLPWWCWTRRWNGANYHLYLPIQHYTLWGAYLHRFCRTCTLLFATSPHCILRRYYWWTDIPTTYRASQLSIELSLSVQVCPHLSSITQDVSVLYWFAFSPTQTYPIPQLSIKRSGFILGFAFLTTTSKIPIKSFKTTHQSLQPANQLHILNIPRVLHKKWETNPEPLTN